MVGPPPASWVVEPEAARAFEVAPGIWQLRIPLPWEGITHVNAFTLPAPDGGIILVDCGSAGHSSLWDALVVALGIAGSSVADVRRVVLTHYHSDHAGLLARLIAESGCAVLGHPAIEHFTDATIHPSEIEAARALRARREGTPEKLVPACADVAEEVEGVLAATPPSEHLLDGDIVESALGPWVVIETPGHAPSHICLHQPELGVLLVGDVLAPAFYPYFDYGYSPDPIAEYFLSFERLGGLEGVQLLLPGHGRPMPDLAEALSTWRGALTERLDASEAAVAAGAETGFEVTSALYDVEAAGPMASLQLAEVLTYLRHLRRAGRVVRRTTGDGSFRYALGAP